jgi:hypothetical protein
LKVNPSKDEEPLALGSHESAVGIPQVSLMAENGNGFTETSLPAVEYVSPAGTVKDVTGMVALVTVDTTSTFSVGSPAWEICKTVPALTDTELARVTDV